MSKKPLMPLEFVEKMAEVIRILGNPQRLRIIEFLDLHGESDVKTIVTGIAGEQSAVSQNLNKMRMAGLIEARRESRNIFYRLTDPYSLTLINCMRQKVKSSIQ